jgi:competence protein ComEC
MEVRMRGSFETPIAFVMTVLASLVGPQLVAADMTVHFINVGQGGGVLVQKDGKNLLYDCGDTFAGAIVTDYLEAIDVKTIDLLIASHAHQDHIGGCVHVLNNMEVKRVYHNGSKARTKTWRQFLKVANLKSQPSHLEKDTTGDWLQILVAYDSHGTYAKEADNSLLARLVDGSVQVLLTGDCEATCEREVSATSKIGSFVLNVGHHGASTASSTLFLSKVKPKIAVIHAGVNNQYGHPKPDVITRLLKAGVTREQIYRTDKQSSIVVVSDGLTVEVDTEK